eukprot:m.494076 g.494076  ORF g.494076 m.494076 type:complete len:300 (-) comp39418_c0_seq1:105-1004(-)
MARAAFGKSLLVVAALATVARGSAVEPQQQLLAVATTAVDVVRGPEALAAAKTSVVRRSVETATVVVTNAVPDSGTLTFLVDGVAYVSGLGFGRYRSFEVPTGAQTWSIDHGGVNVDTFSVTVSTNYYFVCVNHLGTPPTDPHLVLASLDFAAMTSLFESNAAVIPLVNNIKGGAAYDLVLDPTTININNVNLTSTPLDSFEAPTDMTVVSIPGSAPAGGLTGQLMLKNTTGTVLSQTAATFSRGELNFVILYGDPESTNEYPLTATVAKTTSAASYSAQAGTWSVLLAVMAAVSLSAL